MKEKSNKVLVIFLVLFILLSLGLSGFILWDKVSGKTDDNIVEETKNDVTQPNNNDNVSEQTQEDIEALRDEIQKIYEEAYDKINDYNAGPNGIREPEGWIDWRGTEIQIGQEGTIGGVRTIKAYKTDSSKIEPYFTKRAINVLNYYYTDTPYGQDGEYYIYIQSSEESNSLTFLGTVFNTTDSGKEKFEITSATEDTVVAVSKESNFMGLDQYLIFKKEDGKWKIDMFEYL